MRYDNLWSKCQLCEGYYTKYYNDSEVICVKCSHIVERYEVINNNEVQLAGGRKVEI